MKRLRLHVDSSSNDVFLALLPIDLLLQILKVGDVAGKGDNRRLVDHDHPLKIRKSSQAAVGAHRVGRDDDSVLVLDGEDGCSGGDRILRVSFRFGRRSRSSSVREAVVAGRARTSGPERRNDVHVGEVVGHLQRFDPFAEIGFSFEEIIALVFEGDLIFAYSLEGLQLTPTNYFV